MTSRHFDTAPPDPRVHSEMLATGLRQASASSLSFLGSRVAIALLAAAQGLVLEAVVVALTALLVVGHRLSLLRRFPPIGLDAPSQQRVVNTMELNCALNSASAVYAVLAVHRYVPLPEGMLIIVILAIALTVAGQYTALFGRSFHIYTLPHLGAIALAGLAAPPMLLAGALLLLPLLFMTLRRSAKLYRTLVEESISQRLALADANIALVEARDGAEAASRAKSQFLANMSHEIRTPLNGVLGTLDMLGRSTLDPAQRRMVATASSSGDQLLHVLNEILDLSKVEAGRMEIEPVPVEPAALAHAAVDLFRASARTRHIELECEIAPDLPLRVLLDPLRVRQVLLNLIGNALKFTDRGRILVRVQRIGAGRGMSDRLRFEVCDTGIGMTHEAMLRLFEPFTQVDQTDQRRHGGSGLGLAIGRRLAEVMGGTLDAESAPGVGSIFRLDIPLIRLGSGSDAARPLRAAPIAPLRLAIDDDAAPVAAALPSAQVLLVEDNVVNRLLATTMLSQLGMNVTEAEDGVAACAVTRTRRFDLILMDCQMPGMDGFAATAAIRADEAAHARAPTPIVALTASAMPGDADACRAAGMDDYLAKPYTLDQLRAAIAPWLVQSPEARSA